MQSTEPPKSSLNWKPRLITEPRPVCVKNPYADKKAAISQMNVVMRRKRNRPEHCRAYYCEVCAAWHLTHLEEIE